MTQFIIAPVEPTADLDLADAARLAETVRSYWQRRGHVVNVRIVQWSARGGMIYGLSSDTMNGKPTDA